MSFNIKTIAVSAVAFLAAAGGLYALMPNGQETGTKNRASVVSTQTIQEAKPENNIEVSNSPNVADTDATGASATATTQSKAPEQPAEPAPGKLTRQQLTPPPATEEEKLQKAAEQESNF